MPTRGRFVCHVHCLVHDGAVRSRPCGPHHENFGRNLYHMFVPAYSASQILCFVLFVVFELLHYQVLIHTFPKRCSHISMGVLCNTPDVTFHISNSNSCHFQLCVMIFPPWSGFVFHFALSCHAFHIMSSCALHLHTCSSHASEHFPRCPFCNPTLPSPPVHPSYFLS